MTFKLDTDRRFSRPCTAADGSSFTAEFKTMSDEDVNAHDFSSLEGEKAFLRDVVRNLTDIEDPEGKPLTFDPHLLDQMLGYADLRAALLRSYRLGITGARSGN